MIVAVGLSASAETGYVRSLSTISPGSLSSAYRAMKALETANDPGAISVRTSIVAEPAQPPAQAVIVSAQGISAAFAAYGEVMDDQA